MAVTILIIEGDNTLHDRLAQHFKIHNWGLMKAMQPKDIKRMFKTLTIDVVLLCLNNLKNQGLVLIKMIKKMCPSVQIITVNSPDQISLSIEGMNLGVFDDFLMPLDLDSLILRIREASQAKKNAEAIKPSLLRRRQNLMIAARFSKAGKTETANKMQSKKPKKTSQPTEKKKGG